jgi:hypothetical protein
MFGFENPYRLAMKSSGDTLMSLQICRSNNGDKSLEPCIGTVVARPSTCRNCWCEPFCRASVKPSFSRIATTSLGLSTGRLLPISQRPLAGFRQTLIPAWGDLRLRVKAQLLPSNFPEALREFRPACEPPADPEHKLRRNLLWCHAQLLLCRHGLSCDYCTSVVVANSHLSVRAVIKEARDGASFISISSMVRLRLSIQNFSVNQSFRSWKALTSSVRTLTP